MLPKTNAQKAGTRCLSDDLQLEWVEAVEAQIVLSFEIDRFFILQLAVINTDL
jgi:hypothetical protein